MKTAKSNRQLKKPVRSAVSVISEAMELMNSGQVVRGPGVVRVAIASAKPRRISLQDQLRDLFAENDFVLSLAKRLQQKLFGECETSAPVATPKNLEAWISETTRMAREAHALLAKLNDRIEAD